ncbi:MAG: T9SS C-terminal target domain-containing protein [Calditrichaeota bacterium]|nr:MAG: T9SS C-terminal target domain-containing protein [Calditrichota bacterium]MBL1205180.1 T9SS C-terminal target domain-containing protein [Calditrichota bacterium]NOG45010.1 T9SS type A sorting domain-containing protein [Calditrichota bacterium]
MELFFSRFIIKSITVLLVLILPLFGQVELSSSDLPIVLIDTDGKDIRSDNIRIVADMDIIYNGPDVRNSVADSANNYSGKISIEIRGQSSSGWDKKSYGLETQDDEGENLNVSLIDLPAENDWILHAPYFDRSLMRNVLIYELSREMGWFSSRTRYCELVINEEYKGIYVLMEKIKRDKNRVNIAKLNPDETTGDELTGGYILRIDKESWNDGFVSPHPPFSGSSLRLKYQYVYPKPEDIADEQKDYIKNFVLDFENLIDSGDFTDPLNSYSQFINVSSFIDYLILNELSRNVDGYRLSAYFYKEKDSNGGLLHTGPVWDYNFSFGNAGYYNSWLIEGWQIIYFTENSSFQRRDSFQPPFWWKVLFNDPAFSKQLNERWSQLRQTLLSKNSINDIIDFYADKTDEARDRNFEIWPGPGETDLGGGWHPSDPRSSEINSYEDEINMLKSWISDRIDWMDDNIPLLTSVMQSSNNGLPKNYILKQNYPNPFNPATIIEYQIPKAGHVKINIYNRLGQKIKTLVDKWHTVGKYSAKFDGKNLASGIYFYDMSAGDTRHTKEMILIK